jgi:hypothetical protein
MIIIMVSQVEKIRNPYRNFSSKSRLRHEDTGRKVILKWILQKQSVKTCIFLCDEIQ